MTLPDIEIQFAMLCGATMVAMVCVLFQPMACVSVVPLLVVLYHAWIAQTMISAIERLVSLPLHNQTLNQKIAAMVLMHHKAHHHQEEVDDNHNNQKAEAEDDNKKAEDNNNNNNNNKKKAEDDADNNNNN